MFDGSLFVFIHKSHQWKALGSLSYANTNYIQHSVIGLIPKYNVLSNGEIASELKEEKKKNRHCEHRACFRKWLQLRAYVFHSRSIWKRCWKQQATHSDMKNKEHNWQMDNTVDSMFKNVVHSMPFIVVILVFVIKELLLAPEFNDKAKPFKHVLLLQPWQHSAQLLVNVRFICRTLSFVVRFSERNCVYLWVILFVCKLNVNCKELQPLNLAPCQYYLFKRL